MIKVSLATLLIVSCVGSGGAWAQEPPAEPATKPVEEEAVEVGQVADPTLDVEAVVKRHLAARLPKEPVQTIVAKGHLVFMGLQLPLEISIARPRAVRVEADMAGSPMILAFDGEIGWTVSPLQGVPEPETLEKDAEEAVALFADFLWGLLDRAEERGVTLTLEGIESVGNDETYVLALGGAQDRTLYLGGETFLERRLVLDAVFMGAPQKLEALLGDYRDIEGLLVPHDIQLLSSGNPLAQVVLQEVATNVSLDDSIFEFPPPSAPDASESSLVPEGETLEPDGA